MLKTYKTEIKSIKIFINKTCRKSLQSSTKLRWLYVDLYASVTQLVV